MKKLTFIFLGILYTVTVFAQAHHSRSQKLSPKKKREILVYYTASLMDSADKYISTDPHKAMRFNSKALKFCRVIDYKVGHVRGLITLGYYYFINGDYPKAFKNYDDALVESEQIDFSRGKGDALVKIGDLYVAFGESLSALHYLLKAKPILEKDARNYNLIMFYNTIGAAYTEINPDSAWTYCQRAYTLATTDRDEQICSIANNLGKIAQKRRDTSLSVDYFNKAVTESLQHHEYDNLSTAYCCLADYYKHNHLIDKSVYYAYLGLKYAQQIGFLNGVEYSSNVLTDLYLNKKNNDSTLKYLTISTGAKDSLYSKRTVSLMNDLATVEKNREQQLIKAQDDERDRQSKNQQRLAIFLIITFVILMVPALKFHKKIKRKYVSFAGLLALLLLFEFIGLLLHSTIEEKTNNNVFIMWLISVAIASILVPAHHKLENWVEKEYSIRKVKSSNNKPKAQVRPPSIKSN